MTNSSESLEKAEITLNRNALRGKTFSTISLGCPKNLVDSESTSGRLCKLGAQLAIDADSVDLLLLNTCGFLRSAVAEAEDFIRQAIEQKKAGNIRAIVVAGCAVASDGGELAARYPEVDAWLGPFDEARIGEIATRLLAPEPTAAIDETQGPSLPVLSASEAASARAELAASPRVYHSPARNLTLDDSTRARLTLPHAAYLKIADGCDRFCSFCAIPHIRGRFVSKPQDAILDEASRLADQGVRELTLIAQETTFWGQDLYGEPSLKRLLEALKSRNQFDWIRVLYSYPLYWDKDLTALFKLEEPGTTSIVPYVDMPLQHCNSELLRSMNRRGDRAEIEELLARIREEIPNVALRTSLIVGFPGETDERFYELVEFVEKQKFARAGIFEFSPEPGTPAATLDGQVDAKTKARRFERLYAKQERISHMFARDLVGRTMDVLLDTRAVAENGSLMKHVCVGRTYADAPDVDPVVYVTGRNLTPGEFVRCEIVDAQGLDLIAVPTDPENVFVSKEERRDAYEREETLAGGSSNRAPEKGKGKGKGKNGRGRSNSGGKGRKRPR